MTANNKNKWSALVYGTFHTWTTGNDYSFSISGDTVSFGSDTSEATEIPLAMAQDFSEMFNDLFGVDLTQYTTEE